MKLLSFFLFSVLSINVQSKDLFSKVVSVHDGDTFTIEMKDISDKQYRIRIRAIDTPEMGWRAKCQSERLGAETAQKKLEELILNKDISLKDIGRDKYGRLLADVYVGDLNVGQEMIRLNLAHKYDMNIGKLSWCQQ